MSRAPWTIARTLALSLFLMTAAGCKDSASSYIGFDGATDTPASEVKSDSPVADAGGTDASRPDAAPDNGADSGADGGQAADTVADTADDASPTDTVDDAEQGQ